MKYQITHNTGYNYSSPASLSHNELFLHPRSTAIQKVLEYRLSVVPEPQYLHRRVDYFGNTADVFMIQQPHDELAVSAFSIVETAAPLLPDPDKSLSWETVAGRLAAHRQPADLDACQFVFASPLIRISPEILSFAQRSFTPGRPVLAGAIDLMHRIFSEFTYDKSASTVETTVDQLLANRKGVCQDFAHLAVACLRSLGLAARYVSGYLETIPPPGKPKLVGADATHAWVSIFIPDNGWVDFDPTNNKLTDGSYISLAWGRDYGDVAPVKGVVMGGGTHRLSVTVDVRAWREQ